MITLNGSTVAGNAPMGTTIGTLGEGCAAHFRYVRLWGPEFATRGDKLITNWTGTIAPGQYSVVVLAIVGLLFDLGFFQITVTAPPGGATQVVADAAATTFTPKRS